MTTWTRSKARPIVGRRSGETCEICGCRPAGSLSHRRPASLGGPWAPSNLVHACGSGSFGVLCHGWLESNPTWAAAGGWQLLRDYRRAIEVPVYLRPLDLPPGWYLLSDSGERLEVDPVRYRLPDIPTHLPWQSGRPLATTPWLERRDQVFPVPDSAVTFPVDANPTYGLDSWDF